MDTTTDPVDIWLQWLRGFGNSAVGTGPQQWPTLLDESMHRLADELAEAPHWQDALASHVSGLVTETERTATALRQLADAILNGMPPANPGAPPAPRTAMFAHLPLWPALGLAAGRQEDWQAMQRILPELRQAAECYCERVLRMMLDALERWHTDLRRYDDQGPPDAEHLRASWLDALDTCWQDMLADPQHTELLRRLNKAVYAFRRCGADLARTYLKAMGVATRDDLAGTQLRMHQLRRRLPVTDVSEELRELRAEVNTLRREVDSLRKAGRRDDKEAHRDTGGR